MRFLLHGRVRLAALLVVAAGLAAGGIAYASIPDSNGVIQGCYAKSRGQLRVIDTDKGQTCTANENPLNWNQTGPLGPPGPPGPPGPTGPLNRQVTTLTGDPGPIGIDTPFGTIELKCGSAVAWYYFARFGNSGGGQTVGVFDQTNGGAPSYYTIDKGFTGTVYQPGNPFHTTWEMTDNANNTLQVDVWSHRTGVLSCQYITDWTYAQAPS